MSRPYDMTAECQAFMVNLRIEAIGDCLRKIHGNSAERVHFAADAVAATRLSIAFFAYLVSNGNSCGERLLRDESFCTAVQDAIITLIREEMARS